MTEWFGGYPSAAWPWAQPYLGAAESVVVGDATALDFELIKAHDPDLILGLYSGLTQEQYDTLSGIAPTVAQPAAYIDYGIPWQELTRTVGAIVGRADEAEALVQGVEDRFAQIRAEHPEFVGATAVVATPWEGIFVYGPDDVRGRLLTSLGFELPEGIVEATGASWGGNLSEEAADMLDVDVIIWLDAADVEGYGGPLYPTLDVHTQGREVHVDSFGDPLGRRHLVRDGPQPALPAGRPRAHAGSGRRRRPGHGRAHQPDRLGVTAGSASAVPREGSPPHAVSLAGETAARLRLLLGEVRVEVGRPRPAIPAARDLSLALPGRDAEQRLARALEVVATRTGVADRRVRAAFLQGWYAWYVLAPVIAAYHALGRVPTLGARDVRFSWDGLAPPTLWLAGPLVVLADDALADDPVAIVTGSHEALRDHLHDEIVAHLGLLIPWLRQATGLGARMQWLRSADVVSSIFQLVGERCGDEAAGIAEAERLTARAGSPLRAPAGRFRSWRHEELERTLYHRASCCLWWRSGEDAFCMTCPLLDEGQQAARVHDWLAAQA